MRVLTLVALALVACGDGQPTAVTDAHDDAHGGEGGSGGSGGEGGGGGTPGKPCSRGEARCVDGRLRTCLEEEAGWLVEACPEGSVCLEDACVELACPPGARECVEGGVRQCAADGSAWSDPTPCDDDQTCLEGVCLAQSCNPGETACAEKVVLTCEADGLRWRRDPCEAEERCLDGECRTFDGMTSCPAGEILCGPQGIFACDEDGRSWIETPCARGEACFGGRCVQCVRDADCGAGRACVDGACGDPPLAVATEELPAGQVGAEYRFELQAVNGVPPYRWSLADGAPPPGLDLDRDGTIRGTPREVGETELLVVVLDANDARAQRALNLRVLGTGLVITTDRLPVAEEGSGYAAQFEALGGMAPYGWFIVDGALPAGLALGADGSLTGIPSEVGMFEFRIRAVDAATPPSFAEKDFRLEVRIAPLEIIGDQAFDLFVAQVVVLPTITVIPNVPIPYDTQLQARGGLRPYHWTEQPLDEALARFVPMSGIPDGLVLEEDGRLHGAVVDPAQIISVEIPFTMIRLTGFFFVGEVQDSQGAPASDTAIFLLPTLPIGA